VHRAVGVRVALEVRRRGCHAHAGRCPGAGRREGLAGVRDARPHPAPAQPAAILGRRVAAPGPARERPTAVRARVVADGHAAGALAPGAATRVAADEAGGTAPDAARAGGPRQRVAADARLDPARVALEGRRRPARPRVDGRAGAGPARVGRSDVRGRRVRRGRHEVGAALRGERRDEDRPE